MIKQKKLHIYLFLLLFALNIYAGERPKVALVLSGGGAKGFAELPVLEMLEKMDIPIDLIVGTSFGSIVGGLYASGYSVSEIYEMISSVDWTPLFSDYEVSPYESILGNHSLYNNLINLTLGLDMSLKLGKGLSNGQNVYQMLKNFTLKYPSNIDFNDLTIPFKTVATDMLNGEAVIFEKGDLAESIRASMSIPGVFEPCEIDGRYYMDGGLRYNLPINIAKESGADIIIAIDISQQIRDNPDVYDSNPAVAILNTITIAQTTTTKAMYDDASIVIVPDMSKYSTFDFKKYKMIHVEGIIAAKAAKNELEKIRMKIYPDDYDSDGKRISSEKKVNTVSVYHQKQNLIPTSLQINGAFDQDLIYIKNSFNKICNKELTSQTFFDFMNDVYLTGNYKSILPRIYENNNQVVMELFLSQKEEKEAKIIFNTKFEQTLSSSSSTIANISGDIQLRGLTGIGSVIAIGATSITDYGASLFYLQPFNPYLFFQLESNYYQDRYATVSKLQLNTSNYKSFTTWKSTMQFGLRTNSGNLLKLGGFVDTNSTTWGTLLYDQFFFDYRNLHKDDENLQLEKKLQGQCLGGFFDYTLDKQDRKSFAHKGVYLNFLTKVIVPFNSVQVFDSSIMSTIDFRGAIPLGKKVSINTGLRIGTDFTQNLSKNIQIISSEAYTNYDRYYFPQIPNKTTHGINIVTGSISLQVEPWEQLTILGGDVFLRFNGTIGNLTYDWKDMIPDKNDDSNKYPILWSSSIGLAIKLKEGLSILIRGGLGSTNEKKWTPFIAVDMGSYRF